MKVFDLNIKLNYFFLSIIILQFCLNETVEIAFFPGFLKSGNGTGIRANSGIPEREREGIQEILRRLCTGVSILESLGFLFIKDSTNNLKAKLSV